MIVVVMVMFIVRNIWTVFVRKIQHLKHKSPICQLIPSINSVNNGGRDSSVDKSSPSQAGFESWWALTWVAQCINDRGRDYKL